MGSFRGAIPPRSQPDEWQEDVGAFVEAYLPDAPRRILEVGCGEGWLTYRLARDGYDVRGIDPKAPEDLPFERVTLEDFAEPGPFDAVVAVLSLHHIPDLAGALDKIRSLLTSAGRLIAVEFAWDKFDDATVRWCLDRLPPELDEENWLHRHCSDFRERQRLGNPLRVRDYFRRWATEEDVHASSELLERLQRRFAEHFFSWTPMIYSDLGGVSSEEERAAMDSGDIQPTGFRFVGGLRKRGVRERGRHLRHTSARSSSSASPDPPS